MPGWGSGAYGSLQWGGSTAAWGDGDWGEFPWGAGAAENSCSTTQAVCTDSIHATWFLPDRFRPDFLNTFVPSEGGFLVHTDTLERWPHVATVDTTQGPQQTRAKAFNFASTVKEKTKSRTQSQVVLWMEGRSLTMQKRNTNQAEMYFVDSELEMVAAMLAFEEAQRI